MPERKPALSQGGGLSFLSVTVLTTLRVRQFHVLSITE